ncbi:MAG: hypothetical protein R3F30_02000 [Planctomycetota bacterium]
MTRPSRPALTPLLLAAVCTGFGGLLFEVVCIRRAALALGAGSWSVAVVVAGFLLGLGLGGRWLGADPRLRRVGLRAPFLLYLALVLLLPLGFVVLTAIRLPWAPLETLVWALLVAGLAVPMGGAFPHLFPAATRRLGPAGAHALQGCNLAGSVLGASLGAVLLVPRAGMTLATLVAASCYFAAAVLVWLAWRSGEGVVDESGPDRPLPRRSAVLLVAGGFAVLGLQLWMPRRLVFFVGGFLPSLAGTLVAVLGGLTLGSFLAGLGSLRRHLPAERLPAAVAAGLGLALLLVESVGPALAEARPASDLAALLGASLVPALLVLPATLPLGALLPAVLAGPRRDGPVPANDAGRAFLWFSVGAGVAAVLLPPVFELGLAAVLLASALPCLLLVRRPAALVPAAVALALPVLLGFTARPLLETARHTEVGEARREVVAERCDPVTSASVVRDRTSGELRLYTDEFTAAGGARSTYMLALGFLPLQLGVPDGDLAVVCLGTGTTAAALARADLGATGSGAAPARTLHVVELSPAVVGLSDHFPGFASWSRHPRLELWIEDGRRFVELRPEGSLAALTLEPLLPQAPGSVHLYSHEFYDAARRALAVGGLCLQWLPTHALPPERYRALIATMWGVFGGLDLLLLDDSTVLVGRNTDPGSTRGGGPGTPAPGGATCAASVADAWLCGLCTPTDRALAGLTIDRDLLGRDFILWNLGDDRPFIEAAVFAPPAEKAAWLGRNLSWLLEVGSFDDELGPARRLRLEAAVQRAEALWDPLSSGAEEALARLRQALSLVPGSELLHREHEAALALVHEHRATRALARGWPAAPSARRGSASPPAAARSSCWRSRPRLPRPSATGTRPWPPTPCCSRSTPATGPCPRSRPAARPGSARCSPSRSCPSGRSPTTTRSRRTWRRAARPRR